MKLTYLGHSSFVVESGGTRLLIDPFDASCGYPMAPVPADAVYTSHEHFDHNFVERAAGSPRVVRALTGEGKAWATVDERIGGLRLRTVPTYHDDANGAKRGKNAVAIVEGEGLRLVHAGDLGHPLSDEQAAAIGGADVLLVPVGGHYTIDADEAWGIVARLAPKVVIPMHYRTAPTASWPIGELDAFLEKAERVQRKAATIDLSPAALPPRREVWVMAYT